MLLPEGTTPIKSWQNSLNPADLAEDLRFSDVLWDTVGEKLIWREERSDKGVLVCQSLCDSDPWDLNTDLSVRAQVGYGGGDFTVSQGFAYFVSAGRIYRQSLEESTHKPVTPSWGHCSSPAVSPDGKYLIYIHSAANLDALGLVDSQGRHWPVKLAEGQDFYMQPCWHPHGNRVAWICWDHPNMPWDGTALYLGKLNNKGRLPILESQTLMAGSPNGQQAIFQPAFSPDGRYLSYTSDVSGWSNLYVIDLKSGKKDHLVAENAEYGDPAWTHGLRTHGWTSNSKSLYFLRSKEGFTSLAKIHLETKNIEVIPGKIREYTSLKQLSLASEGEQLALIASSATTPAQVLSLSPQGEVRVHRQTSHLSTKKHSLSSPRSLKWQVKTQSPIQFSCGLYYPPSNFSLKDRVSPPTVIKIHGGPTSQFKADYHPDTQFLTTRGFAVLELNYRGSSGFGKAYIDCLKSNWGVLDVEDTRLAADYLVSEGLADRKRLVLMGGSAGGYTLLMCLITYPGFFKAGICRYGVSNLLTLLDETHKFEARYLDSLVGTLPRDAERFHQRSPVFIADRIVDPVAIFQGDKDRVVPKDQSDTIVESLIKRNVPHIYQVFLGEGHGWRKRETIQTYYEIVERFLWEHVTSQTDID